MARLVLKQIEIHPISFGRCRVVVSLACKERIYIGEEQSPNTGEKKLRAVAEATLQTINKLLPQSVRVRLVQCGEMALTEPSATYKAIYFVGVEAIEGSSSQFLSGTCLFTTATLDIAAKATLDAINRKMEKYISN